MKNKIFEDNIVEIRKEIKKRVKYYDTYSTRNPQPLGGNIEEIIHFVLDNLVKTLFTCSCGAPMYGSLTCIDCGDGVDVRSED